MAKFSNIGGLFFWRGVFGLERQGKGLTRVLVVGGRQTFFHLQQPIFQFQQIVAMVGALHFGEMFELLRQQFHVGLHLSDLFLQIIDFFLIFEQDTAYLNGARHPRDKFSHIRV